jgi:hypothetical protein
MASLYEVLQKKDFVYTNGKRCPDESTTFGIHALVAI